MYVYITVLTETGAYQLNGGEAIDCDDYSVVHRDHFTEIRLLRQDGGEQVIIREINVSNRHSYELVLEEDL